MAQKRRKRIFMLTFKFTITTHNIAICIIITINFFPPPSPWNSKLNINLNKQTYKIYHSPFHPAMFSLILELFLDSKACSPCCSPNRNNSLHSFLLLSLIFIIWVISMFTERQSGQKWSILLSFITRTNPYNTFTKAITFMFYGDNKKNNKLFIICKPHTKSKL